MLLPGTPLPARLALRRTASALRAALARFAGVCTGLARAEAAPPAPVMEEHEPRLLYSADVVPTALAFAGGAYVAEHRTLEPGSEEAGAAQAATVAREIVFVDPQVNDYQALVDSLVASAGDARRIEVVVLDPERDGVAQVSAALASEGGPVQALHFLTHGTDGAVRLGQTWLSTSNLGEFADTLAGWKGGLAEGASLLLYGCDVADNAAGRALVDALHALTGAGVAASVNPTGNAGALADWALEYSAGTIMAGTALSAAIGEWGGILAALTVNTNSDLADGNTSSVAALLANKGLDAKISLREAILAANNTAGLDTISFSIGGGGLQTISPLLTGLPTITDAVVIDGTTQPGYAGAPLVELNGSLALLGANGLSITGGGSTIKGLVINRFGGDGISITGAGGNTIEGNYIGVDATGTTVAANGRANIYITGSANNTVGGTVAGAGNVIAYATTSGVIVIGNASSGNAILGNSIYGNTSLGIDLREDGISLNNGSKPSGQPNLGMDFPVFTSALYDGAALTVTGYVGSAPGQALFANARVEVYASDANLTGYGEGRTYLGALTADTGGNFSGVLAAPGIVAGNRVTGTATDGLNNTSEFGANRIVINSVNDAPAGASKTVMTLEDTSYTFVAADFGFSDSADSPANAFLAVKITTVPGSGALTVSGVAVSAGQFVSTASIIAGNLKFTPAANGTASASFTFQVQDDGGTANGGIDLDSTPRTLTVNVTAVNDVPVNTVPAAQDSVTNIPLVFSAAGGNAIAIADIDAGANPVEVTLTAADGYLTLSGTAGLSFSLGSGTGDAGITFTGTIASINAALDGLRFDPALNYAGSTSLVIAASDLGNTGSGGAKGASSTVVINVTFVNTAPVLAGANDLQPMLEDAAGDPGTLVSVLIAGHTSDADTTALAGIAVTAVDNTDGTWEYTTDGGNSWSAFGSPADSAARLLAVDSATFVRFQPHANSHGAVTNGITFRAWDRTAGAAGGVADTTVNGGATAFSSVTASAGVNVLAVSDAPSGTDKTVTLLEDAGYAFTAADFGYGDSGDAPSDAFAAIKITTLPGAGALQDNGIAVTAGQFVSMADINAGKLVFIPATDANGAGHASFTFQVQDDGGTASGGVDLDPVARTLTIDVTAVNDAPAGADRTVTTLENTAYTFTVADFGFTDPGDGSANSLAAVKIVSLPGSGALRNDGAAVTAGQFVSVVDIIAGKLVFMPAPNATGQVVFNFKVQDDGGTANGGLDLDPVARALTVDVVAMNTPPAISGLATAITEARVNATVAGNQTEPAVAVDGTGNSVVVWTSDGNQDGSGKGVYARLYNAAGIARTGEFLVNTTTAGDQRMAAVAMSASGDFVVTWTSNQDPDGSPGVYAQRFDAAGIAQGAEFRVNVTTAGAQDQSQVAMDGSGNFVVVWKHVSAGNADIYARRFDAAGNALSGEFRVNTDVTANQDRPTLAMSTSGVFVVSWKSTNRVDDSGNGVFAQRYDAAGAAQGGEFQVNTTGSGNQDKPSAAMTASGDFVIAWVSGKNQDGDKNGVYAQRFDAAGVKQGGEFRVNTVTRDNQDLPSAAMDGSGNFVIAWASNGQDGQGKGIYAQRFDAAGASVGTEFRVNETTANNQDQPAIVMNAAGDVVSVWQGRGAGDNAGVFMQLDRGSASMREDGVLVFSTANGNVITVADIDAGAGLLQATLNTTYGVVTLSGTAGLTFLVGDGTADPTMTFTGTLAIINAALDGLTYAAAPNFNGRATLALSIDDQGNNGAGGARTDSKATAISVTGVNDAPDGTDGTVSVLADTACTFKSADFGYADLGDTPANAFIAVRIATLPGAGILTNDGIAVGVGQLVAISDIDAGKLMFTPSANGSGTAYAAFTFQVQDDGGTVNGGVDLDASPNVVTVNVAASAVVPPTVAPTAALPVEAAATPPSPPAESVTVSTVSSAIAPTLSTTAVVEASAASSVSAPAVVASISPASLAAPAPALANSAGQPAAAQAITSASSAPGDGAGALSTESFAARATPANGDSIRVIAAGLPDARTPAFLRTAVLRLFGGDLARMSYDAAALQLAALSPAAAIASVAESVAAATQNQTFIDALDRMRDKVAEEGELEQRVVGSAAVVGSGISVGYVIWLLRGGVLLSSLLSSLPAWRFVDPLPILSRLKDERTEDEDEDGESLESLVGSGPETESDAEPGSAPAPAPRDKETRQ